MKSKNNRRVKYLLMSLLSLFLLSCEIDISQRIESGLTLSGQISNRKRYGIEGATIKIHYILNNEEYVFQDFADLHGVYQLPILDSGNQKLTVEMSNYKTKEIDLYLTLEDRIFDIVLESNRLDPPENLSATIDGEDIKNRVLVEWNPVDSPVLHGYNIYRSETSLFEDASLIKQYIFYPETVLYDEDLIFHRKYYYWITSINIDDVESKKGEPVSIVPLPEVLALYEDVVSDSIKALTTGGVNLFVSSAAPDTHIFKLDSLQNEVDTMGISGNGIAWKNGYLWIMQKNAGAGQLQKVDDGTYIIDKTVDTDHKYSGINFFDDKLYGIRGGPAGTWIDKIDTTSGLIDKS